MKTLHVDDSGELEPGPRRGIRSVALCNTREDGCGGGLCQGRNSGQSMEELIRIGG